MLFTRNNRYLTGSRTDLPYLLKIVMKLLKYFTNYFVKYLSKKIREILQYHAPSRISSERYHRRYAAATISQLL